MNLKIRVSRGVRGSPAFKAFARRADSVKEGRCKIGDSNVACVGFAPLSHGLGSKLPGLPRLPSSVKVMVPDFAKVLE